MCTCQKCGGKWSWYDAMKKAFRFRKEMTCSHCGEIQYQSKTSRNTTSLLLLLPLLMIPINAMFGLSITSALIVELTLLIIMLLISPRFLTVTNEEEPFW